MSKWIIPSDRLPEPNKLVLMTVKYEFEDEEDPNNMIRVFEVVAGYYDDFFKGNKRWIFYDGDSEGEFDIDGKEVRAWMPLPEPYKEDTDDE